MKFVRTFSGDIAPEQMGFTLAHEHLVCLPPHWVERKEDDLILDDPEKSLLDVLDFKNAGGQTIVDATAVDYGRCVKEVNEIGIKAGVYIIGTAGFNKSFLWDANIPEHLKPITGDYKTYNDWIANSSVDQLADFEIKEITEGLEGTELKAGQVKFGTGYNMMSPLEIKTIEAAVIASNKTGAPVHSHTEAGTLALKQIEVLRSCGMDLEHVSFGHMDRNLDRHYHRKIAETGAFICFDGIGKIKYHPEDVLVEHIVGLIEDGFENQILISGDTARKSYYKHYQYGLGLAYSFEGFIPLFKEIAEEHRLDSETLVNKLFRLNPQRCMTFRNV